MTDWQFLENNGLFLRIVFNTLHCNSLLTLSNLLWNLAKDYPTFTHYNFFQIIDIKYGKI